jgi:hypothetical protein
MRLPGYAILKEVTRKGVIIGYSSTVVMEEPSHNPNIAFN